LRRRRRTTNVQKDVETDEAVDAVANEAIADHDVRAKMAPQSVLTVTDHDAVVDVVAAVAAEVARTENPVTHERLLRVLTRAAALARVTGALKKTS